MSNCSQNFKKIFTTLARKGVAFDPFLVTNIEEVEDIDNIIDNISRQAVEASERSSNNIAFYNFKEAEQKLALMSKKYPSLNEEVIDSIIDSIKQKLSNNDSHLTNPLITAENGTKEPLFNFDNLSGLVGGIQTMEAFIDQELEEGLFKAIFINNINDSQDKDSSNNYEPFVVTNQALNNNLAVYKNKLWDYIINASGIKSKDVLESKLYVDGVLNKDLFLPRSNKSPIYAEVLQHIKNRMDKRFDNPEAYKYIKIHNDSGYSLSQAYLKTLILANFDNFILSKHTNKVAVNYDSINSFAFPTNNESKYKLMFKWSKAINIDNSEKASDINKNTPSLVQMLANIIPYYKKVTYKGKERWVIDRGLTIGKSNLDSVGAIINNMNPTFKISIKYHNQRGGLEDVEVSIADAFGMYDLGLITFDVILKGVLEAAQKNDNLTSRESIIKSIYEFLYSNKNGLVKNLSAWKLKNPNFSDIVINAEVALVNHLRNTVKNIYRKETLGKNGKTIDVLNIESAVGKDFDELLVNLQKAWKTKKVTNKDVNDITNYESYIDFLTNPQKGGLTISNTTLENFKEIEIDFNSPGFKKNFKKLLSKNPNLIKTEADESGISYSEFNLDEMSEALRSKEVNDNLRLIELFKLKHYSSKYNILTQVKDFNSNSLPTMGIANLASLFSTSLAKVGSDNFFKKNPELYSNIEILLELEGKDTAITAEELQGEEMFKFAFNRNYLMSSLNENKMITQPWNYSDKPKIFGVAINTEGTLNGETTKQFKEFTARELKKEFYNNQQTYYSNLLNKVLIDFKKLDKVFFDKWLKNHKMTTADQKIKAIEAYLETVDTKDDLLNNISDTFNAGQYTDIVEDLHYSVYKGKIKFNQNLKANIQIFHNPEYFETFSKIKEQNLLAQLPDIPLKEIILGNGFISKNNKIEKIAKHFNINPDEIVDEDNILIKSSEDNLSEIFSRYLWSRNLVISQYANLTTKDSFLHPAKKNFEGINLETEEGWEQYIQEEHLRSTTFTKRMNMAGASMTMYSKGRHGISQNIKVAAMSDPVEETFNFVGDKFTQDTADGGAQVNPFFNELMIWSLPGLDLQRTQKPIGESITDKHAVMLKFATFAINNEEIRKSMFSERSSYIAMKKMNSFPIHNINPETGDFFYENIMKVFEKETGTFSLIDITSNYDNLWVPINGTYNQVINFEWVEGTNEYKLTYSNGNITNNKIVTINNLFDLWESFGGAFSAKKVGNEFVYSEDSINLVSSIIKKHSLVNSSLGLKDKMISMLVPQTAIKKGAVNINTVENTYNSNKELSFFNFDTTFFGVQLTAFHSTDQSTTNEITQVISGIAENASTPELYNEVYTAISNLIEHGLNKFKINTSKAYGITKMVDLFVKSINNSSQINNSRVIINGITDELNKEIPLGNKTIYKQFVSHIISNINVDFIRRKFAGSGSILVPSQGVMKLFESNTGKTYFPEDLLRIFTNFESTEKNEFLLTLEGLTEFDRNKEKINWVINNTKLFKGDNISSKAIQPLDSLTLNSDIILNDREYKAGEIISLVKLDDFFGLKEILKDPNIIATKDYSQTRDLRPVLITYTKNGEKESVYNSDSLQFSWWLGVNKDQLLEADLSSDNKMFTDFYSFIEKVDSKFKELPKELQFEVLKKYAQRWVHRTFDLLAHNKSLAVYDGEQENPFESMLSYTDENGTFIDNFTSRYEKGRTYSNEEEISDYVHKRAENIHTNVHKTNFELGNTPHSQVTERNFLKKLVQFSNIRPQSKTPYDVIFSNFNSKNSLYIALENNKYYELDNKLYNKLDNSEVGTKTYINEEVQPDGTKIRLSNYGEKLYALPSNYSIFKDINGNEIILIKAAEGKTELDNYKVFTRNLSGYDIIKFNDFSNYKEDLFSNDEEDGLLNLIQTTIRSVDNKYLRKYLASKANNYKRFKQTLTGEEDIKKAYNEYLRTRDKQVFHNYVGKLSEVMYKSWKYSNLSLSARIPAQAMQSFMSMDTVGYLSGDANDIHVSHWQLWLQGSDFDIDKLYMMMYDFKNGIFQGWSPFFDITNDDSFKLTIPNGKKYGLVNIVNPELSKMHSKKVSTLSPDNSSIETEEIVEPTEINTFDLDDYIDPELSNFDNRIILLNELNKKENKNKVYLRSSNDKLMKDINYHNSFMSEIGFKNYIVSKLLQVSDHPSNQVSSYTPISFGIYEEIKKKLGDKYKLSLYDGHSMFKQQEQNIVGKKVIGIAATGLKDYFGLVKYFSDYYEDLSEIDPTHNAHFLREFTLNNKTFVRSKISGLNLKRTANNVLKNYLTTQLNTDSFKNKFTGEDITPEDITKIIDDLVKIDLDEDASLTISSILSLATDNAKELMLAKINAGIDFASMHIYLAILGIDTEEVAKFMTSEEVEKIKKAVNRDFFKNGKNVSIVSKLKKLNPKNLGIDEEFFKEFMRIYDYSSELTSLGSMFKVNQGSKAAQEELYKLTNQFKGTLVIQESSFFSSFKPEEGDLIEQKIAFIIKDKPYLLSKQGYVRRVLQSVEKLPREIDIQRYFEDASYRKVITDYYNLIKYTFNVFDVLDNLPHFNNMFKSFVYGETFLMQNVNKYNFLRSHASKVVDFGIKSKELDTFEITKNTKLLYNNDNPILFSDASIAAINDYYDSEIITGFINDLGYKMDLTKLMDYLGISSINLLRNNKRDILEDTFELSNLPYRFISLDSEFGIAQFRYLMENYIIPHEKQKHKSNGFLSNYTFNTNKNFNLKNRISYYLDRSNFSELEKIEVGMSLLINTSPNKNQEFEMDGEEERLGSNYDLPVKLNADNNIENFKLVDLLTLYDLIVNEGRFGGNRATIFFSKDISNPNSVSRKFVEFQKRHDGNKRLPEIISKELMNNKNKRDIFYLKVFGNYLPNNEFKEVFLKKGNTIRVNRYFSILENVENASINLETNKVADYIIDLLKNKNINIQTICK